MEFWEIVNENGEPTGELYERGANNSFPSGKFFRVVEVWVRIGDRILVTQRHPDKWAGLKWEVSGGGVIAGENIADAAVRELFEETGISASVDDVTLLGCIKLPPALIYSYMLTLDALPTVTLDPSEVVDYKFVTREEFESMLEDFNHGTRIRYNEYSDRLFK